jgi:hypothetical protein
MGKQLVNFIKNISVILWWPVLLVEETGVPGEKRGEEV